MKKIGKAAALLAALLLVIGITACPQRTTKKELGTFKVIEFKFGGRAVSPLNGGDIGAISPKTLDFEITADANISSVVVESQSENATFKGSAKKAIGNLTKLPIDTKELVTFTVKSEDKKDVVLIVPITFKPESVLFEKIYVDSGVANSAADITISDGSIEVVAKDATAVLTVETKMDAESVKVTVNGNQQDAVQVNPKKYTLNLTGLTASPVVVKVEAFAPLRRPGVYTFKVKKGDLNVDIISLKVNGEGVSVSKASSAEGLTIVFDKENLVKAGMVPIEVEAGDTLTSKTVDSTEGILKGSLKESGKKFGFFAACFSKGKGKQEGQTVVPEAIITENTVTITLQAAGRKDTVLTIKLSDSNALPYGVKLREGTLLGHDWNGFVVAAPVILTSQDKLTMFGKTASLMIMTEDDERTGQKATPFAVFKRKSGDKDWIEEPTLRTADNSLYASKPNIFEVTGTTNEGQADLLYAQLAPQGEEVEVCAVMAPVYFRFPGDADKYKHAGYFAIKNAKFKDLEIPGNSALKVDGPTQQDPTKPVAYIPEELKRLEDYLSSDGYTVKVKKAQLSDADKLYFFYFDMKEYTEVTVKKSHRASGTTGSWEGETSKKLKKDGFVYWNIFNDLDENIKNLEAGKEHKYELEITFKDGTAPAKFTVVYDVEA